MRKASPILYVGCSAAAPEDNDDTGRSPRGAASSAGRTGEGTAGHALRYAAAEAALVAARADSADCGSGVQRDSHAGPNASLRSAGLAARRKGVCVREAMHLGILAPDYHSDCVVASKSWHGGDEHHSLRWAMDAQSNRAAGIWDRDGKFLAWRTARTGSDGQAAGRWARLRDYP